MLHYLKRTALILLIFQLCLSLQPGTAAAASRGASPTAAGRTQAGLRLLSSSSAGVAFEVQTAWEDLRLETATLEGRQFTRITLPGWGLLDEAGKPVLPFVAEAIGAPVSAVLTVQVSPGLAHRLQLAAPVLPGESRAAGWEQGPGGPTWTTTRIPDPAIYAGEGAFPGALAQITSDGFLRQQRVAGVSVFPIQYEAASRTLVIYESLRVEVAFQDAPAVRQPVQEREAVAFEQLLQKELLNYDAARQWRQGPEAGQVFQEGETAPAETGAASASWTPPSPAWRVKVRADGFYRLTYAELQAAGVPVADPGFDPRTLQLFYLGQEAAIEVVGEEDGKFDAADTVVFYGQAAASKYTADNVYWLTYGKANGLRMAEPDGAPGAGLTPASFTHLLHLEQNQLYIPLMPGDEALERWAWSYIYAPDQASWSYSFSLTAPSSGAATLNVALLGYLENTLNPDHHARLSLNGTLLGDVTWDGITWKYAALAVPAGLLHVGSNTLTVSSPNDTGVGYDLFYIDWAELSYPDTYAVANNVLAFGTAAAGSWLYQVSGFTTNQVSIFDVTDPYAVARFKNVSVSPSGPPYTARFEADITAPAAYWAMAETTYQTVQALEADTASSLKSMANGADYIVIAPAGFAGAGAALRDYRAMQGLRARWVDVQDVYDEFGYGLTGASAIHDFLAYAYANWQAPAPAYVTLLGDGHYDPKNYSGFGRASFIPPYLARVDPWMGETAADNRYVTLSGADTLPDMMLGRISVNTLAEANAFVNKIKTYELNAAAGDWQENLLMVADNADSVGNFAWMSDDILSCCMPRRYHAEKIYLGITHANAGTARPAIQASINAGKLIVNFTGHADITAWAAESLLTTTDVASLQNNGKLPVVLAMTCREGYFIMPDPLANGQEALGEVITRADGKGAIASWSPSGLGVASGHDSLNRGFFNAVLKEEADSVGKATLAGKLDLWSTNGSSDLLDTYLLFGDPALRISIPPPELEIFLPAVLLNN